MNQEHDTLRICLWSGPRNVSTALMYAFARRADTRVVDEPLYAHYLRVSGARHPGRDDVLAAQDSDGDRVVRDVILGAYDRPIAFFKLMAHHLVDLDLAFLDRTVNILLTRDPRDMLPSLINQVPEPVLADTGVGRQCELLDRLRALGQDPVVLDARALLADPRDVLEQLTARLGIGFDPAMMSWPAGPIPEDGVWAPHWYHNVHKSTGFGAYHARTEPMPASLQAVYADCKPHYDRLRAVALEPRGTRNRPS